MPDNEDLLFCGRINASAAHELKNVLAVINEQVGLLADLACLAGRGHPLDPERLAATAARLQGQVRRGDAIIGNLGRFAHLADVPGREVSLAEAAALAVALWERQAAMRRVPVEFVPGDDARVATDPFTLCRLLTACLDRATAAPAGGAPVRVAVECGPQGPALVVTGLAPGAEAGENPAEDALAARIGASLSRAPGRIAVRLPAAP